MNVQNIVRSYIRFIRPHAQAELNWFRSHNTIRAAVKTAACAINRDGKMYSHQWRVRIVARGQALQVLLDNLHSIEQSKDFDNLFSLINKLLAPIKGIGELYIYDTSLRIGSKLNLLPQKVYLHAGTRVGAKAIGFDISRKYLTSKDFRNIFQPLQPHEIEDLLCIFKEDLKKSDLLFERKNILKRSWCG